MNYNNQMREIATKINNQFQERECTYRGIKYIECIIIPFPKESPQKGDIRLMWNNMDGCIEDDEKQEITAIVHVIKPNGMNLISHIEIEDQKRDIQNVIDQSSDINPTQIFDRNWIPVWNVWENQ